MESVCIRTCQAAGNAEVRRDLSHEVSIAGRYSVDIRNDIKVSKKQAKGCDHHIRCIGRYCSGCPRSLD